MLKLDQIYLRGLLTKVGREALMSRFEHTHARHKADGSLVTEADLESQRLIRAALESKWPDSAFLGEEMTAEEQAGALADSSQPLWVLDPLDGTTNYASGMPFFCISLALLEQGRTRLGMVYDPVRDECFWAEAGQGAWLNDCRLRLEQDFPVAMDDCLALVDYKRLDSKLAYALVTSPPFRSQRSLGSVALEWCWLAAGRCTLYLHGGQRLWDFAAGCLIHQEAGGALWQEGCSLLELRQQQAIGAGNSHLLAVWKDYLDAVTESPVRLASRVK